MGRGINQSDAGRVMIALAGALLVSALMYVPLAPAASVPLGGGETKITFTSGFYKALSRQGIAVRSLGQAELRGRRLTLPIESGSFDSGAPVATFGHGGGFKLVGAKAPLVLTKLMLDSATKSSSAVVAGKRLRLAFLGGSELEPEGFDARLKVKRLHLTGAGAGVLNRLVGAQAFRAGLVLGSAETLAEPTEIEPRSGKISIGGPDTTLTKLQGLKVDFGIWGATEVWGEGVDKSFLFPIQPTRVAADASAGIVVSEPNDGLTMQRYEPSGHDLLLRDPRIDFATRELSATISPLSTEGPVTEAIGSIDFGAATVRFRPRIGVLEMSGIRALSNQFVADQLNDRLAFPGRFQAGETLARMAIILRAS